MVDRSWSPWVLGAAVVVGAAGLLAVGLVGVGRDEPVIPATTTTAASREDLAAAQAVARSTLDRWLAACSTVDPAEMWPLVGPQSRARWADEDAFFVDGASIATSWTRSERGIDDGVVADPLDRAGEVWLVRSTTATASPSEWLVVRVVGGDGLVELLSGRTPSLITPAPLDEHDEHPLPIAAGVPIGLEPASDATDLLVLVDGRIVPEEQLRRGRSGRVTGVEVPPSATYVTVAVLQRRASGELAFSWDGFEIAR